MTGNSSSSRLDNATLSLFQNTNTSIAISLVYLIVVAINLVGNGFSIWILLFRTSPKTPSIVFMIHLTLTDLALGAALPFQIAYQLQGYQWNLGPNMCRYTLGLYEVLMQDIFISDSQKSERKFSTKAKLKYQLGKMLICFVAEG